MKTRIPLSPVVLFVVFFGLGPGPAPFASAAGLTVPLALDRGASSLTTTLCVQGTCESDTHPLDGELLLAMTCSQPISSVGLRDLRFVATTNHHTYLSFGFGGAVDAELADLVVRHTGVALPVPMEPLASGSVTFRQIPTLLAGLIRYEAVGLACVVVQLAGLPCNDDLDLATRSTNTISALEAQLTISGTEVVLIGGFGFQEFIDPDAPDLGRVEGNATFTARGDLRPSLTVEPDPTGLRLSWCRLFEGFRLERAPSLDGSWEALDTTPESSPDEWSATVPAGTSTDFFRLRAD